MSEELTWLPAEDTRDGTGDAGAVDLATQTGKLRALGRRAVVFTVFWLVVAGGVFAGLIAFERRSTSPTRSAATCGSPPSP